eukprot:CAMPEP_0202687750 /NCGR_PEP_ID=MMETSP1385-20130828/3381_1 /ASSEMBLY_ACC=CAM_ASM_000861 /TAXON_ID=933848 /ORGANISM="Elphidium margaritaceum" /LENGTH=1277 /DNA_ID=CAMNT_0049342593 /DNA_START=35 /DNA_END=3868 /DNA_ORIENTATION=+
MAKPLRLRHIFGFRSEISNPLSFIDEQHAVYTAGHFVVTHNTEDKTQSFIGGQTSSSNASVNTGGVTAIDVHVGKKLIAVAEKSSKVATVQIFEFCAEKREQRNSKRRRKLISCSDMQSQEVICVRFSHDAKFLLIMGGAPDWCLLHYARDKGRVIHTSRAQTVSSMPFYAGSYCPADSSLMVCTGHKVLKFYRVEASELKPLPPSMGKREPQDYTAHCWDTDRRTLVTTEHGDILLFDGGEFRGLIWEMPSHSSSLFSIVSFRKGFICGGDNGALLVFERSDDGAAGTPSTAYRKLNQLTLGSSNNNNHNHNNNSSSRSSIVHLAMPPSEELLACVLSNNQMYAVNLSQIEVLKTSHHQHHAEEEEEEDAEDAEEFEYLLTPFHDKAVTGLDLCVRKPYLATCGGDDHSVKIWNWHEKRVVLAKTFAEQPLCVALHPSGLHLVVGFADKLRLMNVLMDDIGGGKDFSIKGCTEVRFSNGGQYFAAINASTVQIYETYTWHNYATLRGHTAKVTSLWWYADDSQLVTSSADNSVLVWDIHHHSRTHEHQHKGCSYIAACLDARQCVYAAGNDDTLKVIADGKVRSIVEMTFDVTALELMRSAQQQRWLFVATTAGILLLYKLSELCGDRDNNNASNNKSSKHRHQSTDNHNNDENATPSQHEIVVRTQDVHAIEIQAHTKRISRLRVSHDGSMVITVSHDGSVCVFDTTDNGVQSVLAKDKNALQQQQQQQQQLSWAEEILVRRSDLDERLTEIGSLRKKVDELRSHNETEIRVREQNYQHKLKEVHDKFERELDDDESKYRALRNECDEMQTRYEDMLSSLTLKHEENLTEVESYHKQKIKAEKQRFSDLQLKMDTLEQQWSTDTTQRSDTYNADVAQLKQAYESKIECEENAIEAMSSKIAALKCEFEEMKVLLEKDAETEIADINSKYEEILKNERTQTLELRGNNGMLKRDFAGLQQRIKSGNEKMQKSQQEQNKLIDEIRRLEKDIDGYEREINERDSTIKEKNKMIQEVQKKNQELEKFKFVLDYKINELDRQIKPREAKIEEVDTQIREMNDEGDAYLVDNRALSQRVKELKLKLKSLQHERQSQNQLNEAMTTMIKVIAHQLAALYKAIDIDDDLQHLKQGLIALHKQFLNVNLSEPSMADSSSSSSAKENSNTDNGNNGNNDLCVHDEFQRHRNYLERTIQGLEYKLVKDAAMYKKDGTRIMQENVALIKEINELRREIDVAKTLKSKNRTATALANNLKRQIRENQSEIHELSKMKQRLQDLQNEKE